MADQELQIVDYKTFASQLSEGEVSDVTIYHFASEIEVTYTHEGVEYGASGPMGLSKDDVLHQALESQGVDFKILTEDHPGESASHRDIGGAFMAYTLFSGVTSIILPLTLVLVILIQALTIRKLAVKKLPKFEG